jgi:hypothetical protein
MTILPISYTPTQIVLASDMFGYWLKKGVLEEVLNQKLQITHENLKECVERIERDRPKIHRLTKNMAVCCGGDSSFSDIIQNLNTRKDVPKQILARLKNKKLNAFWTCHIPKFNKKTGKCELTDIVYDRGTVKTKENTQDNISFDSFALETKDLFFKKYVMAFYVGNTEEKTKVIQEFFSEITELFQGDAGGQAVIAKIDKDGFKWIVKPKQSRAQNFTAYSHNWCPEKIETTATTEYAWSDQTFTVVLELSFECESTMLLFISAFAAGQIKNVSLADWSMCLANFHLKIDGSFVATTEALLGSPLQQGKKFLASYSTHSVAILPKGSHTLQLCMRAEYSGTTAYCTSRRLTIMKGFYQGGAT